MPALASHLQRPVLFALNTGARDDNVCGLRWEWEVKVPELKRSVFVIPAAEFKGKRDHVLILNDAAWDIVEACRDQHATYVFVYQPPASAKGEPKRSLEPHRIGTLNTRVGSVRGSQSAWPRCECMICATPTGSGCVMLA